jgi:hypothetical protein
MQRPVSHANDYSPVDAADGVMNRGDGMMNGCDRPMNRVMHWRAVTNYRGISVGRDEGHGAGHSGEDSDHRSHCRLPSDTKLRRASRIKRLRRSVPDRLSFQICERARQDGLPLSSRYARARRRIALLAFAKRLNHLDVAHNLRIFPALFSSRPSPRE